MKNLLIAIVMTLGILHAATVPAAGASLDDIEAAVKVSGMSPEARAGVMQKAREAIARDVPAEDVLTIVKSAAAHGMDGRSIERLLSLCLETRVEGLPVGPVLSRIEQGVAKGVPAERIVSVTERLRSSLRTAHGIVLDASARGMREQATGERVQAVERVAAALEADIPYQELADMGGKAAVSGISAAQFGRAVAAVTNLKEAGMPRDLAIKTGRQAIILRFSEQGIGRMERAAIEMRRSGMSWERAFTEMNDDMGRGERGRGGMQDRGPGAGGGGTGFGPGGGQRMERR